MKRRLFWFASLIVLVLLFNSIGAAPSAQAAPLTDDVDTQIADAERAAPTVITQDATFMGWDEDGMPSVVLREGTNGWTCLTDWPVSPGDDPACYDPVFSAFNDAYMAGEEPQIDGTGIGYMLAGGSDPSNTDPFAMEPAPGEDRITTPAHIMIVTPAGFEAGEFATEPKQDEPYIMWDGTPYEHLMVPVVPTPDEIMGDVDEEMANILRSAPAGIALNATIMGDPEQEGDPMVVVKEGTNGWICYPDGAVSPGNDPSCSDPMMDAFWSIGDTEGVTRVGLSYMLQGGSDPSNTDPNLSSPPEGEDWVTTAPHVMLVAPGGFDAANFSTEHMSGLPYIMYADTGYQHLMIPVADMPAMDEGEAQQATIEQMKAEAVEHELGTFDLYINRDWATLDAETGPDYFGVGVDGSYTERDAMLAGLQDEKLTVLPPDLGDIRVLMITPDAYMVTYPLNFNGIYDGAAFSNPRTVSSLWVKRDGAWQNIFLAEEERTVPFTESAASRIAHAERAAPKLIAQDATIMDWDEDGMPSVVLREGTNGWTCLTDWPASPGDDPACYDPVFSAFNDAYMAGEEPQIDGTGIGYMLVGGSDPSNTDPFATEPAPGEDLDQHAAPRHGRVARWLQRFQFATEPSQDLPYIMWDGTPYEHLMQPVPPMAEAVSIPTLDDADAQAVLLAEQELNYAADFLHDADTANQMLAEEYQEASTGDRQVKADKLAWIKSGIYMGQKAEFSDVTVEFDGDTATIHFTAVFTGIYDGSPYVGDPSPVTNVWVKRDGRWQMMKGG